MASLNFNANNVEPQEDYVPIAKGWHRAEIVDSEMKPTSKNNGEGALFVFKILDGEFTGRKTQTWINVFHDNETVQKIGQQELARLCEACGVVEIRDTEDLHYKPLMIKIGHEPGRNGDPMPVIQKYAPADGDLPNNRGQQRGGQQSRGAQTQGRQDTRRDSEQHRDSDADTGRSSRPAGAWRR